MQSNFMFYDNFLEAINQLPESERANACYQFCKYAITEELPEDKSLAMFCVGVRYSVHKYQGRGGARVGAGRPKKSNEEENQKNQKNQNIQKNQNTQTETETKTETEKEIHKEKESDSFVAELEREVLAKEKKTRFVKPTLEQIKDYCKERNNNIDAEYFYDYYERNGWKVSKNPMKDWRACIRTWERNDFNRQPQKAQKISSPDYVGEGSFLRRAEDDPFCADL